MTPGMKKVLAEIEKETDVNDDFWRHAWETKYGEVMEEHTDLWRLLRRITEGESKRVVMSIKNEDGFRAWQRLKQRCEPGLAARQSIVMAEFSGMVARRAKSPGETIALLTEMDRKMKLLEDVTEEEVSKMHARTVLVGILEPVTRQHTAMNHSKSYEALKKMVQEFANNSTTGQEALQTGRVPLRRRQPGRHQWQRRPRTAGRIMVLSTPRVHNSAGLARDTATYPGSVPMARARAKARTTLARALQEAPPKHAGPQ